MTLSVTQPKKLLEFAGESWLKGISPQFTSPVGGLFQSASNFDPFKKMGVYVTSNLATRQGSVTISSAGYFNIGFANSTTPYFYSFGNNSKVFRIQTLTGVTADVSAQISGVTTIRGAAKYKGRILYASDDSLHSNVIPLSLASQIGLYSLSYAGIHAMKIGPDRNLYITDGPNVAKVGDPATVGGTGNTANYFSFESDVICRDLETDGKYLVIAADTADSAQTPGAVVRCFVAFWNMKAQDLSQIWEFQDSAVYGIKFDGEEFVIWGKNNIYACNIDTPIHVICPLQQDSNADSKTNISTLSGVSDQFTDCKITHKGPVLWAGTNGRIFGYGRPFPGIKKIFFQPYSTYTSNETITSLFSDGIKVWYMNNSNQLFEFGSGSPTTSTLIPCEIDFKQPYRYAFIKVLLRTPLASGQSVAIKLINQANAKTISDTFTMSYSANGAVSSAIFYPKKVGSSADVFIFQDITNLNIINTGAQIRRIEIWGTDVDPVQDLGY